MTVSTTTNRAGFVCNGVTYQFPFDFKILAESDLQVYLYNTITRLTSQLTLNVDYTVEIASPGPGGTVTLIGAYGPPCPPGVIPGAAYTLTILRAMPRTQEIDFVNGDDLDEQNIEGMGDRITMMVQELDNKMARTLAFPPTSGISNISVPDPVAGAFLRWNLSGNGLENATYVDPTLITISDYWRAVIDGGDTLPEALTAMGLDPSLVTLTLPDNVTISDFIKTLLDDNDAAAARATLQIPAASESVAGLAELATQAEVDAGTDDARIVTPKKLADYAEHRGMKNLLINGCMRVCQRGSQPLDVQTRYGLDRWNVFWSSAAGVTPGTQERQSTTYLETTSCMALAGLTCTGTNVIYVNQRIESANAKTFLNGVNHGKWSGQFKFWHNFGSSVNVYLVVYSANAADNFSAITERYVSSAQSVPTSTWTSLKFEGIDIPTTDMYNGLQFSIKIETPVCSGKTIYIGDAQFEIGPKCTTIERRPYGLELALCQRYYEKSYDLATVPGTGTAAGCVSFTVPSNSGRANVRFQTRKRAAPALTYYASSDGEVSKFYCSNGTKYAGSVLYLGENGFTFEPTGISAGYAASFHWVCSAEL